MALAEPAEPAAARLTAELEALESRLHEEGDDAGSELLASVVNALNASGLTALQRAVSITPMFTHLRERSEASLDMALTSMAHSYGGCAIFELPVKPGGHVEISFATNEFPMRLVRDN